MKILRAEVILALFYYSLLFAACGGGSNANIFTSPNTSNRTAENTNTAKSNVEDLSLLVKVPYEAEDVVWKEDTAKKRVIAVLRFSREDGDKIVANAQKFGAPENASIAVETWFPDELIAQGQMSGDGSLKGLAYAANDFVQEPYTLGRITRIEECDYFVLDLSSK